MYFNICVGILFTIVLQMRHVDLHKMNSTLKAKLLANRNTPKVEYQRETLAATTKLNNYPLVKAGECVKNIKIEDQQNNLTAQNWTCRVINSKKTRMALLCSCSYEYECSESQRIYFSLKFNQDLASQNKLNAIDRGADYQCENSLRSLTKKSWSCHIEQNAASTSKDDDLYCECEYKKACKFYRLVDLY